jgi:hypothetical protein
MNDMIRQLNCQLGHVDIDGQGQLVITSKPFGNLQFDFDYHAPSHIAGNNRPGFMIIPPNKGGDKKKSKIEVSNDTEFDPSDAEKVSKPIAKPKAPGTSMSADKIKRPGQPKINFPKASGNRLTRD